MLDLNVAGVRSAGAEVRTAGDALTGGAGIDVPAFSSDEVSTTIVANLNQRRRWLAQQIAAGQSQAFAGADGIAATATGYEAEDHAGADRFAGSSSTQAPSTAPVAPGTPAPGSKPSATAIPDISGTEGETLAIALAAGPGATPALQAAADCTAIAAQAEMAAAGLTLAGTQLLTAGVSAAHGPLLRRLTDAVQWSQGIAAEATALAAGYTTAAASHTATQTAVGTPAMWRTVKTALNEAIVESQLTGGLANHRVQSLQNTLVGMQTDAGIAMTNYQTAGQQISDPPLTTGVADPNLTPGAETPVAAGEPLREEEAELPAIPGEDAAAGETPGQESGLMGPLSGILGQVTKGMGQNNPLSQVGKAASQVGDQLSKAASGGPNAAVKPTTMATAKPSGKSAGLGKSGGGAGIGPSAAVRPASSLPAATPTTGQTQLPAATAAPKAAGITPGGAGGMGMMPMGAAGRGSGSSKAIDSYPDPLDDVPGTGRPGVVGDTSEPAPIVKPEVRADIRKRIAARRAHSGHEDQNS